MQQLPQVIDDLDDAEAGQIAEFLQEVFTTLQSQGQPPQAPTAPLTTPMPQGVELLWILSNGDTNAFVNYLRTYPGEGLKELVSDPAQLSSTVARLQHEMPLGQPRQDSDGMDQPMYQSSTVSAIKYDPKNKRLFIKFHSEGQEPVYQYDGVPPQIFELLKHGNAIAKTTGQNQWGKWWKGKTNTIGEALNAWIKKAGFPYTRIR
jgi:hypothetical protein